MPIHPDQRHRYPPDWPAISTQIRTQADWHCEQCHVEDRAWGWRDPDGAFVAIDKTATRQRRTALGHTDPAPPFWEDGHRIIEVVLTVAHLNHRPEDNRPENLRALCQRCHLAHDRPHHLRIRATRRRLAMATPDLPLELPLECIP